MAYVGLTATLALPVFSNTKLYRKTKFNKVPYKLFLPKFGTRVTNPYKGCQAVTSSEKPFVLELFKGFFINIPLQSLSIYTNSTDTDTKLTMEDLVDTFGNKKEWGINPNNQTMTIYLNERARNTSYYALRVPEQYAIQWNNGTVINNPKIPKGHAGGDFIVIKAGDKVNDLKVVNGHEFKALYDHTNFTEKTMAVIDKNVDSMFSYTLKRMSQ